MYSDIKMRLSRPIVAKTFFFSLLSLIIIGLIISVFSSSNTPLHSSHHQIEKKIDMTQSSMKNTLQTLFFGNYLPKNLSDSDIKQSMLNLTVVGIMYARHDEDSLVIIQTGSGTELTYHIGDKVPGGAIIRRVVPDGVFVERDGVLESLSLPKKQLIFVPPAQEMNK